MARGEEDGDELVEEEVDDAPEETHDDEDGEEDRMSAEEGYEVC